MKNLNIKRQEIIAKIYITKTDVRDFLRCSNNTATDVFDECYEKCIKDGYENVKGRIYYKYLLDKYQIKESDIHRFAKIEREIKNAPTVESQRIDNTH